MTTQDIALFRGIGARMNFLNQRQRVIAQNISNADTPGYRPQDLRPVDFSAVLGDVTRGSGRMSVKLNTTNGQHLPPANQVEDPQARKQRETYEVAPAGNAVIMEEQLLNAGQTVGGYNLMANLYEKNVGLLKIAIGSQR